MTWSWDNLPTEAEMAPKDFGSKQVYLFLKKITEDIFSGQGGIFINHCEDGTITINQDKVYQSPFSKKWMHVYTSYTKVVIKSYADPFDLFKQVCHRLVAGELIHWELINYACVA